MESQGELTARRSDWSKNRHPTQMRALLPFRAKPGQTQNGVRVGARLDLRVDYIQELLGDEEYKKILKMVHEDIRLGRHK